MAKLFDVILDIDFDGVCRLCLSQHGVMTNIYDGNKESTLSDRILSLASVQILPDDGLPGLICHTCRDKVEKFVKFREQIEHSYYLLCQCIGVTTNDADNQFTIPEPGTSSQMRTAAILHKDKSPTKSPQNKIKGRTAKQEDHTSNTISSLFKDHLVSGISDPNLLVNPQDGFVNVSYVNVTENSDAENADYMPISLTENSVEQQTNIHSLLTQSDIEQNPGFKLNDVINSGRVYSVSFPENTQNNLQDIFLGLEEDKQDNGFEDITKFLKVSQGIDFKKIKEDYQIKIQKQDANATVDADKILKKLTDRGFTLVKNENDQLHEELTDPSEYCAIDIPTNSNQDEFNSLSNDDLLKADNFSDQDENLNNPDIRFARMATVDRDSFTFENHQEEIVPRMVRVSQIYPKCGDPTSENVLKFKTYLCHLCLVEYRECNVATLMKHSEMHFTSAKIQAEGLTQNSPMFNCELCSERFNQRQLFVIHQRKHFGIRPFVCSLCKKTFAFTEKLNQHMAQHFNTEAKLFSCAFCFKTFETKQELQSHEKTHILNAPLICTFCNKTFSNVMTLKMHTKRHIEGMKHCCEICGKAFYFSTLLKRHEQLHSGQRKFPCNFCAKAFCSNSERRRHLLYHFKNKQFKCTICNKSYYESGHLKIHMRIHTNTKPYTCTVCTKSFLTGGKLKRHLKMHQKDMPGGGNNSQDKTVTKSQNKVVPKFTRLKAATEGAGEDSLSLDSPESMSYDSNIIRLDMMQDNEDESYIIIEGDDSNLEEVDPEADSTALDGIQAFADDSGQVFYVFGIDQS